jgi:class 3 adenylate cyclase/tetratricopeptide (TPR) repeat protein
MKCPQCQHENPGDAVFCQECGIRLEAACPSCGTPNQLSAKFCKQCGQRLSRPQATQAVPGLRFVPPESYTPKHLAEKILSSKSAIEGERKQVTVLFADLKGSMELLADRDPEEARKLLDPVLERMMEAVHHYEGTVNQVMGDGIMALFGAPVAHEDHGVRACYAALRMLESVSRYGDEIQRSHGVPVQIRVGLNSGEVVVRSIGNDLHMDYSAIGQTTHLAARMEQQASPGAILITGWTARLAEGYVAVRALGPKAIRGLAEPVETYELLGLGPARSRLQAAIARGLTRFVGREAEIAEIRAALDRAASGHGQLVALVGEPGVGKSRLVAEFTRSTLAPSWRLVATAGASYERAAPYRAVLGLLRAWFGLEEGDDAAAISAKVVAGLAAPDALTPILDPLLALLGTPVESAAWQGLGPAQQRRRILDAVRQFVIGASRVRPLCVVFEDLQWMDEESLAVLDRLVETLPTVRVLLLVSYRPEFEHEWGSRSDYTQLRVPPLPPGQAELFLTDLVGHGPGLAGLTRILIERTEGNPFFLEELVRHLVETGALSGRRGTHRVADSLDSIEVPPTVQAVLAARLDRRPRLEKELLQAAAVIGKDVPLRLLSATVDLSEKRLTTALAHLQQSEFLYEVTIFPDTAYSFTHALTHEVAYGSLLRERRRALDARIVEAIEELYPHQLPDQLDRLAHHAFRGEVWDKALTYCGQAGTRAFARSAHRAAVDWFERALRALERLPETPYTTGQAIDLRLQLRYALSPLGEFAKLQDYLKQAEGLAQAAGDLRRLGLVTAFLTNFYTIMLDLNRAVEAGERAVAIGLETADPSVQVLANTFLGLARYFTGAYREAAVLARRNIELLHGDLLRERFDMALLPSVYSRTVLAWCLAELGEFVEGADVGAEAIRIGEAADHPYSLTFAFLGAGYVHLRRGDAAQALPPLERAMALCRSADIPGAVVTVALSLAPAYVLAGRPGEALRLIEESVQHAVTIGDPLGHWLRTVCRAEAQLALDQAADALPLALRAVDLARFARVRGNGAWALRLLGEIAAHADPPDLESAETHYGRALARADELGMRPLAAHCHLGLGKLYRRTGDGAKAGEHLTIARAMYREMGMGFWLEKAEVELGPLNRVGPYPNLKSQLSRSC